MNKILLYPDLSRLGIEIYNNTLKQAKIGLTGGFFNPLHSGHLNLLEDARRFCSFLIVAISNDDVAINKHGYSFMSFYERSRIVSSLKFVDMVIENPFNDMSTIIERVRPHVYLKGGDVNKSNLHPHEVQACLDINCEIIFNVGGSLKVASSSNFLNDYWHYRDSSRDYKDEY